MLIVDEWRNANNERVVMTDTGRLMVLNEKGQPLSGAAVNRRRCDRSAQNGMRRQADDAPPFLEPVPYYLDPK